MTNHRPVEQKPNETAGGIPNKRSGLHHDPASVLELHAGRLRASVVVEPGRVFLTLTPRTGGSIAVRRPIW